ncbi:MAG: TonB-dependent receptor, partial [Verrucomicrobia bacterium]|nr:TonB-dependent receptor [Deltaproteobacteria bacterium]
FLLDFTWYNKKIDDLILQVNVPTSSGFTTFWQNAAAMDNTGIEIGLDMNVVESRNFSMGALINTPENRQLLKVLQIRPETSLLVLPVVMLNKVVAVVLITSDMDALGRRLAELQKLVRKASLAFEMLIIKNKILMT